MPVTVPLPGSGTVTVRKRYARTNLRWEIPEANQHLRDINILHDARLRVHIAYPHHSATPGDSGNYLGSS
ncbi:hypothetical protein F183_A17100 [Bryobacterales bacterium F-183]|nr:hypothetical protein F183_A17100 [Bryobacterales bacterium F-183]